MASGKPQSRVLKRVFAIPYWLEPFQDSCPLERWLHDVGSEQRLVQMADKANPDRLCLEIVGENILL